MNLISEIINVPTDSLSLRTSSPRRMDRSARKAGWSILTKRVWFLMNLPDV